MKKTLAKAASTTCILVAALLVCFGAAVMLDRIFPFPVQRLSPAPAQRILDRHGQALRFFLAPDEQWRFPVRLDEVSPDLITALVHSEDRFFYHHPGVNPIAIARAAWANVRSARIVSGGSTIPMQLARLAEPRPRTLGSKIVEALRAIQLCTHFSRDQILTWYLNLAPFGGNVVGVGAASWYYFGKTPATLSLGEIALLTVLPRSPAKYNPRINPQTARGVRNQVLAHFQAHQLFPAQQIRESLNQPLLVRPVAIPFAAPHYTQWLHSQNPGPAVLRTTLDTSMQRIVQDILAARMPSLRRERIGNVSAVVLDSKSREILAYVGSADFWDAGNQGQVDMVRARRSPGSALKPLLYALAFDQGHLVPESRLLDVPTDFAGYAPQNYGQNFQGLVRAHDALAQSLNIPAVRLLARCGVPALHNLLRSAGLTTLDRPSQHYGLALALGGCDVRLLDLVNAYATLASAGLYREPHALAQPMGGAEVKNDPLLSPAACAMVLNILQHVTRPHLPDAWDITRDALHMAWKTGTSFGHRDAWAIGVGHGLVIGVWAGNPDGSACASISGARHAGPLLFDLFRALCAQRPPTPLSGAPDLVQISVCAVSGMAPGPHCPVIYSPAIAGVTRLAPCSVHRQIFVHAHTGLRLHGDCLTTFPVREETALFWPAELVAFARAQGQPLREPPPFASECQDITTEAVPEIISPSSQTPYVLRQDAPADFQRLALSAAPAPGATLHYWYVDGRFVGQTPPITPCFVPLEPGTHNVHVTDNQGRGSTSTYQVWTP